MVAIIRTQTQPLYLSGRLCPAPSHAWIALQETDDGRVRLCPVNKLLQRETPVLVSVHLPKNLVRPFLGRRLVFRHLHDGADHLVDGADNLEHLVPGDVAVAVKVVHVKGPAELVLELASRRDREGADKLPKVDRAVLVFVKRAEDVLGEL